MKNSKYHKPPIICRIRHNCYKCYKHSPSRVAIAYTSPHCTYGVGKDNEASKCLLCEQNVFRVANLYIKEH